MNFNYEFMNFKSRIRSIERKLNIGNKGIDFKRLLDPDFVYKGKPFDNIDEMYEKLHIVEIPSFISDNEKIILLEKRLLSIVSIIGEEIREKFCEEMKRMM